LSKKAIFSKKYFLKHDIGPCQQSLWHRRRCCFSERGVVASAGSYQLLIILVVVIGLLLLLLLVVGYLIYRKHRGETQEIMPMLHRIDVTDVRYDFRNIFFKTFGKKWAICTKDF
jgi:H+/Cl- antiporter ClcA